MGEELLGFSPWSCGVWIKDPLQGVEPLGEGRDATQAVDRAPRSGGQAVGGMGGRSCR